MASVFHIYDQRPTSKSKATEYFTWSLKKIKNENWDANVSFYWHKNAADYCQKRQLDIFGSEEQEKENDANDGRMNFLFVRTVHEFIYLRDKSLDKEIF